VFGNLHNINKKKTIEDLLNDPKMSDRLKERLYSKKGLLGKESPFGEILQQMVNTMLEGRWRVSDQKSGPLAV
jgi:hypothetical protein